MLNTAAWLSRGLLCYLTLLQAMHGCGHLLLRRSLQRGHQGLLRHTICAALDSVMPDWRCAGCERQTDGSTADAIVQDGSMVMRQQVIKAFMGKVR